ncbi:hypothetical protein FPQ18DRAFT_15092 [Pyronema domesticum]|nr:hypothetical protein FPQ18DRAFT_15092 [Pyronema domesticum]
MTLTVPTGRTSLVHPLTEEFYDNPDTPNTAYSFQDPSTVKPNMQNDPSHLAAPITDAMMVSTDDEMLDSDSDPRRDEDFDIDLDNDIYSVSGDLPAVEVTMTMDEDPITYDEIEQEIDDDIMLDDEPIEYTQEEALNEFQDTLDATLMGATQHEDRNTLQDSTQAEAFSVPEPVQSDQQVHEEVPQPAYETTSQVTAVSEQNEPTTVLDDTNVAHSQLDQVGSNEAVAAQLEPLEPVTDEQTALFDNTQEPVQELDDSRSFSTATLTHGTPAADEVDSTSYHEEAVEHELQTSDEYPRPADFDPPTEHDTYDSQYQYPIIVEYEQNQLTLFPSMSDWTENPMFTEVYHNIPSRYLLQDESTCDKLLKELFLNLRNILDQAVDADSELILEIKLLGLKLNEVSSRILFTIHC